MHGWRSDVLIDARVVAYRRGGIERYVNEIANWMPYVAPDLDVVPFVNRRPGRIFGDSSHVFTPPHHRFERVALGTELSIRLPRLIHSPDFIAPGTIGPRRIVTVHDLTFLTHPELLTGDSRRYYGRIHQSLRAAARVIAVSRYTANELIRQTEVEPGKVVTILNGTDPRDVAASFDAARNTVCTRIDSATSDKLLSGRPVILTVGTVEPRKRHELLLRSLESPHLGMREPRPLLLLAGQRGWACDKVVSMIEQGKSSGNVIWLETVNDELLAALYRIATVVAVPSQDEGFGLPLLEAMQAGTAVIAAANGALPEVAGDAAMLISGDDPGDWGSAIARVLDDPQIRAGLRDKGLSRAAELTWERTAARTAAVYREVLGR